MLAVAPLHPLLEMKRIDSLDQLQSFFNTIVSPTTMMKQHQTVNGLTKPMDDKGKTVCFIFVGLRVIKRRQQAILMVKVDDEFSMTYLIVETF